MHSYVNFIFESGDINVSVRQSKKIIICNVVPTFEDLKKETPYGKKIIVWGNCGAFAGTNEQKSSRSIGGFLS